MTGAKNSVLKLMAAALLAPGVTTLSEVPDILDVAIMSELLRRLGCDVQRDRAAATVTIDVPEKIHHRADYDLVRRMRASIAVLGPLLARTGEADVALPGGDAIGSRPLDFHIAGLLKMGATVENEHGFIVAKAKRLTGATIWLDFPSVGATENLVMAAVLADGRTEIDNAAREPEIVDLCCDAAGDGCPDPGSRNLDGHHRRSRCAAAGQPRHSGRPHRGGHVGDGCRDDAGRCHGSQRRRRAPGDRARQAGDGRGASSTGSTTGSGS